MIFKVNFRTKNPLRSNERPLIKALLQKFLAGLEKPLPNQEDQVYDDQPQENVMKFHEIMINLFLKVNVF